MGVPPFMYVNAVNCNPNTVDNKRHEQSDGSCEMVAELAEHESICWQLL